MGRLLSRHSMFFLAQLVLTGFVLRVVLEPLTAQGWVVPDPGPGVCVMFCGSSGGGSSSDTYYPDPYYAPPIQHYAPPIQREVIYPNGKYVLYGDGVTQAWRWVWVAAAPPRAQPGN